VLFSTGSDVCRFNSDRGSSTTRRCAGHRAKSCQSTAPRSSGRVVAPSTRRVYVVAAYPRERARRGPVTNFRHGLGSSAGPPVSTRKIRTAQELRLVKATLLVPIRAPSGPAQRPRSRFAAVRSKTSHARRVAVVTGPGSRGKSAGSARRSVPKMFRAMEAVAGAPRSKLSALSGLAIPIVHRTPGDVCTTVLKLWRKVSSGST